MNYGLTSNERQWMARKPEVTLFQNLINASGMIGAVAAMFLFTIVLQHIGY